MIEGDSISSSEIIPMVKKEEQIFKMLSPHPNVLKHYTTYEQATVQLLDWEETVSCLILEYAQNGNLNEFVKYHGGLPEQIALFFFTQIWSVVSYMHELDIVHLDLKPQNFLLDINYNIRVSDFGSSEIMSEWISLTNRKGTRIYMAPEMFPLERTDPFDGKKADVFSLGMTLLTLLRGVNPDIVTFDLTSANYSEVDEKPESGNQKCRVQYEIDQLGISEEWKTLLKSMLAFLPEDRPWLPDILNSFWVQEGWKSLSPYEIISFIYSL
jgi:serine/threonine protein kinase